MKIGIDARFYAEPGGIGRYLRELIKNLEEIDNKNQYVIFLNQQGFAACQLTNKNFTKILADITWYTLKEQTHFTSLIKKTALDIMHFPHWNAPLNYCGKFVVTIHDLILLRYSSRRASTLNFFSYLIKNAAYKMVLKNAARRARMIIAPSQFTKNDIIKALKIPKEKVAMIYQGVPDYALGKTPPADTSFLRRKGITRPYFLYVGAAYPHKNLERLLAAFKIFRGKYGKDYQLLFVGKENYFYRRLKNLARSIYFDLPVIFTDFVEDTDLNVLYQNAAAFIFPSLYEGFGLPPLEAMARKTPVLSSNASCLLEILDNAALFFNPLNPEEMALKMNLIATDQNLREKLARNGILNLNRFSFKKCAQLTLQTYKNSV